MFTSKTIQAMKHLTDEQIRREAGVNEKNMYVFASTKQSTGHASGWQCINEIVKRLNLKGALNATNLHRVASMLAKLQHSKKEQELIFQHFGHSEHINKEVYQAPPGSMQPQTTGKRLLLINTGLRKDERSIVSDTWNNKCGRGKKFLYASIL